MTTLGASAAHRKAPQIIALAIGAGVGALFGLFLLPWDFVLGTGVFWASLDSDRAAGLIGYHYFVADAWRFPVFAIGTLNLPDGTSAIYTDSIPLVSLAMKAVHALGVPSWTFYGMWVLCCFALNGLAMALVLWHAGVRSRPIVAVAALVAATFPVFLHRWYHFALFAQFLLLLGLAFYVAVTREPENEHALISAAVLVVVALGINPYLWAMVFALYVATVVQAARGAVGWRRALAHLAVTCVVLGILMVTLGHVSLDGRSLAASGYGHHSLNLLSPFASNLSGFAPESWERLRAAEAAGSAWPLFDRAWPDATGGQSFEGFGYLGVGLLLLCALHAPYVFRHGGYILRRHWPLCVVLAAATLFALSNRVYLGGRTILEMDLTPALQDIVGVFRSSGRFFWVAAYALLAGAMVLTVRRFGRYGGFVILALVAAIQLFDTTPLRRAIALDSRRTQAAGLDLDAWRPWLSADLGRVYIVPSFSCGDPVLGNPKLSLQYEMARVGPIPTNSVYASRTRPRCGDDIAQLENLGYTGNVGWVFFPDGQKMPEVERFIASQDVTCRTIGNALACRRVVSRLADFR